MELKERHWACWEKGKSKLCPCLNNNQGKNKMLHKTKFSITNGTKKDSSKCPYTKDIPFGNLGLDITKPP
jgi:hypothetical protein